MSTMNLNELTSLYVRQKKLEDALANKIIYAEACKQDALSNKIMYIQACEQDALAHKLLCRSAHIPFHSTSTFPSNKVLVAIVYRQLEFMKFGLTAQA